MKLVEKAVDVKMSEVTISPFHFRDTTVDRKLEELANSMKTVGQVHPVSVVRYGGKKELINGHRRYKAANHAGLKTIRADIYEFEAKEVNDRAEQQKAIAQFLLAANMSEPLLPLERARYWFEAIENLRLTPEQLAEIHSVPVSQIEEDLRFLNLSPKVVALVQKDPEKFTPEHLKVLAKYSSPSEVKAWRITEDEQVKLAERLTKQEDKREVHDPRVFERKIKDTVNDRRQAAKEEKKQQRNRDQAGILRDFLKLLDKAEKPIADLAAYDFNGVTAISKKDKHHLMSRLFEMSEKLASLASEKVSALSEEKAARKPASKGSGTPVEV